MKLRMHWCEENRVETVPQIAEAVLDIRTVHMMFPSVALSTLVCVDDNV